MNQQEFRCRMWLMNDHDTEKLVRSDEVQSPGTAASTYFHRHVDYNVGDSAYVEVFTEEKWLIFEVECVMAIGCLITRPMASEEEAQKELNKRIREAKGHQHG